MSTDARNSLIAWGAVLAFAALFWLGSVLMPVLKLPGWVTQLVWALILLNFCWDLVRLARARARA